MCVVMASFLEGGGRKRKGKNGDLEHLLTREVGY